MNACAKNSLKWLGRAVCRVFAFPFYLFYLLFVPMLGKVKSFQGMSQFFSLVPGVFGEYLRREFYRLSLARCSKDCCISFGTIFTTPAASIGRRVYIGAYCVIGNVSIGDDTLVSSCVEVISGGRQHYFDDVETPIREQGGRFERVSIGEDCWIGEGAMVMASVGKKSVVGARSLVHKEIPEYSVAAGSPARVIRSRKNE